MPEISTLKSIVHTPCFPVMATRPFPQLELSAVLVSVDSQQSCQSRVLISIFVFKFSQSFSGYFNSKYSTVLTRMFNFRGDLTDISAQTESLVLMTHDELQVQQWFRYQKWIVCWYFLQLLFCGNKNNSFLRWPYEYVGCQVTQLQWISRAADFTYYFDTGGRRRCYLAPERFQEPASLNLGLVQSELTPAMDIFSVGCVIAELLTDEPLFKLSDLISYRRENCLTNHTRVCRSLSRSAVILF